MSKSTRFALLILAAVVVALTIFTYPSFWGFISLTMRTVVILGALFIIALLIAGTFKRKPGGAWIIILLTAVAVIGTSYPQLAATLDANRFDEELQAAGAANVFDVIATSETRAGTLIRESYAIADRTNAEIEGLLDIDADPALSGLFDTTRMLDPVALLDAQAVTTAFRADTLALSDRIDMLKLNEVAAIDAIPTQLPDSARLLFLDAVRQRVTAEADYYHRLAAQTDALNTALAGMVNLLVERSPNFGYDDAMHRPAFTDPADNEAFGAFQAQATAARTQIDLIRTEFAPTRVPAALAIVEGVGATP